MERAVSDGLPDGGQTRAQGRGRLHQPRHPQPRGAGNLHREDSEGFKETRVTGNQQKLYDMLCACDSESLQEHLRNILLDTICYYDYHENYYHALLVGLLLSGPYRIRSNAEMGNGRSDIVMEDDHNRRVVIIEVKRSRDFDDLEADCERAICEIQENNYAWPYKRRRYTVFAYGIAFSDKDCGVRVEKL